MKISIRGASEADLAEIAALSAELGYPTDPASLRARLRDLLWREDQLAAVALTEAGQVCGWMQAHSSVALESGFRVEIVGLVVVPAMRRHGVGRRLVQHAEAWAAQLQAEAVVVRSNVNRRESHAFYRKLGYARTKMQTVYRKQICS